MSQSKRIVRPELLDHLEPDDPRARRSRSDLQRVHRAMASVAILGRAIQELQLRRAPQHILELGGGDGTLLLRIAKLMNVRWPAVSVTLLDRHNLVTATTRDAFARMGWSLQALCSDMLQWAKEPVVHRYDLGLCTLFLHHFDVLQLPALLTATAARVDAFVACEPRRNALARAGSHLVGMLGANAVTRNGAVTSVAAGFGAREITAAWPAPATDWNLKECWAPPFTHCFTAVRKAASGAT